MTLRVSILSVFFICILLLGISFAQQAVVIPLTDEVPCVCNGMLSPKGRWCNEGEGYVLDMTTCLVWLRHVPWGGEKPLLSA